jgi:copper chaperone CopZ
MGFKDSWMAMADLSPDWKEAWVSYAITARDAVGAAALHMRSEDGERERDLVEANYTRLLHRWNLPEAQANVCCSSGLAASAATISTAPASPSPPASSSTTRPPASTSPPPAASTGPTAQPRLRLRRVGFSLYEVDYDEVQPWIVVEARRMREPVREDRDHSPAAPGAQALLRRGRRQQLAPGAGQPHVRVLKGRSHETRIPHLPPPRPCSPRLFRRFAASSVKATVNGMVCAFCAQGIEKRLSKMPASEAVFVDLKRKVVVVEAKPGQTLDRRRSAPRSPTPATTWSRWRPSPSRWPSSRPAPRRRSDRRDGQAEAQGGFWSSWAALLASSGTLVCCALPALFVAVGAGAALSSLVSTVPQLVWLSENKEPLFVVAGPDAGDRRCPAMAQTGRRPARSTRAARRLPEDARVSLRVYLRQRPRVCQSAACSRFVLPGGTADRGAAQLLRAAGPRGV